MSSGRRFGLPARSVTDLTEPAAGWLSGRPDLRRLHLVHYGTPAPAAATSRDVTALTGRPCEVHEGSAWNHHSFHAVYAEPATAVLVAVASEGAVPAPLAPAARTLRQIAVATHLALADRSLLVEYARSQGAKSIVRGLRATADFEYEFQMAMINRRLADDVDSVFLMTKWEYSYLSSSIVREVALLGGDYRPLVPPAVAEIIGQALSAR